MLNLYELARVIKEPIEVTIGKEHFTVRFKNCETKECESSSILGGDWGSGSTIDEAADDLFSKINGKWLVFKAGSGIGRKEYAAEIAKNRGEHGR